MIIIAQDLSVVYAQILEVDVLVGLKVTLQGSMVIPWDKLRNFATMDRGTKRHFNILCKDQLDHANLRMIARAAWT